MVPADDTQPDSDRSAAPPRLWVLLAVVFAVLLHLPARVGAGSPAPLFEDGPALVSNPAFEAYGNESAADVVLRAATDPRSAWAEGGGAVGRARFRPVAHAAYATERRIGGAAAHRTAGWVGLAALCAAVVLAIRLATACGIGRSGAMLAGAVVAAAPSGLAAADWAARHAASIAAALGAAGLLGAASASWRGRIAGAVALGAAGLAHEGAFGLALAAPFVRAAARRRGGAPDWTGAWPSLACAAAAFAWRAAVLGARVVADDQTPAIPGLTAAQIGGAAAGVLRTLAATVVPAARSAAPTEWTVPAPLGLLALGACVALLAWAVRRRADASGSLVAGCVAAVAGGVALAWRGGPASSDEHVFLALPVAAVAVAALVARGLRAGGRARLAAAACGALLVASSAAATLPRAGSFRTRDGQVRMAMAEDPDGLVTRAWRLAAAVQSASAAPDVLRVVREQAADARALAAAAVDASRPTLRRDPVAAATVAGALQSWAAATTRPEAEVPPADELCDLARDAAASAAAIVPDDPRAWLLLSAACDRVGALRAALDASAAAARLAPEDPDALAALARSARQLGQVGFAADVAEQLIRAERAVAASEGRKVRPEVVVAAADAWTADGPRLMAAPEGPGYVVRFEGAIALLEPLATQRADPALATDCRERLARTCILYGDMLASAGDAALALHAYARALAANPGDAEAAMHREWLVSRLEDEHLAARAALDRARAGKGNVGDALVGIARSLARQAKFAEAEEVYGALEAQIGESPELRFHRAVELLAVTNPAQARAELAAVVAARPLLGRPAFELAKLLERAGEIDAALAAYATAIERADRTAISGEGDGGDDWAVEAVDREETLQLLRLAGTAEPAPAR